VGTSRANRKSTDSIHGLHVNNRLKMIKGARAALRARPMCCQMTNRFEDPTRSKRKCQQLSFVFCFREQRT